MSFPPLCIAIVVFNIICSLALERRFADHLLSRLSHERVGLRGSWSTGAPGGGCRLLTQTSSVSFNKNASPCNDKVDIDDTSTFEFSSSRRRLLEGIPDMGPPLRKHVFNTGPVIMRSDKRIDTCDAHSLVALASGETCPCCSAFCHL